jgi:aerobic carbon-monoxide dehydrogenase medium subunit
MRGFELVHPASFGDAIEILDTEDPSVRAWSGGTALMLMMKTGVFQPSRLVCLGCTEKSYASIGATPDGGLRIGAMATLTSVEYSADVIRVAPVIARAMKRLSNVRVRNVARIGGNLAHGDPHMDLPPVLACLGAEVSIDGPAAKRRVAVENLFSGYYETVLKRGELITEVIVPPQRGWASVYLKCTTRSADDWPTLGVAVSLKLADKTVAEVRIAVSAATEKLTRLGSAEQELAKQDAGDAAFRRAAEAAAAEAETIDDSRGSAAYKSALLRVYVQRALREALHQGAVQ